MSHRFDDVQEAAQAMPGLELAYRQLQPGPVKVEIDFQQIAEVAVAHVGVDRRSGGRGGVLEGSTLFLLCTDAPAAHIYDDLPLTAGRMYVKGGGGCGRQVLQPGYGGLHFLLPDSLIENHQRLRPALSLRAGAVIKISSCVNTALRHLNVEGKQAPASLSRHVSDAIVSCLCQGLALDSVPDYPFRLDRKVQLANQVRERLEECQQMTLGDICHDLAVSERTLRRVFGEVYDMSPGHYQLLVRLNQVRDDLKACGFGRGAVSEVAARHGFWHMGRFSSQYRRLFGETATQTLQGRDYPRELCATLPNRALR